MTLAPDLNDPSEPDRPFIVDNGVANPMIALPRKRLLRIMRGIADALGYADRATTGYWFDDRNAKPADPARSHGLPDVVLMVSSEKGSRRRAELTPETTLYDLRDALADVAIIAELAKDFDDPSLAGERERFLRLVLGDLGKAVNAAVRLIDQAKIAAPLMRGARR